MSRAESQSFISLKELFGAFSAGGVEDGIFVLVRGYIDESYDGKRDIFAMSCLLAEAKPWFELERQWKLHLAAKNKELKRAGRPTISRYHASECHARSVEFEGWSRAERDDFVLKLFGILRRMRGGLHAVGYDVSLDELSAIFPEGAKDRLEAGYNFLTAFILYAIGEDHHKCASHRKVKITLFHDRTERYDAVILTAFNKFIADPNFVYAHYFKTIAALSWRDCIALQPADLVAFEVFKDAERRRKAKAERRPFRALLDMNTFGIHSGTLTRDTLKALRERMKIDKLLI